MKRKSRLYLFIVFSLIYISGSIFCISYFYKETIIISTILIPLILVLTIKDKVVNIQKQVVILLFLVLCMLVTMVAQNVSNYSSYIAIMMQLFLSLIVSCKLELDHFISSYVTVMRFIAAVSLVCLSVYIIYPNVALLFPKISGQSSLDYYFAGLFIFPTAKGYEGFVPFYRNCGVFWEPGCYAAFLNLATFFHISRESESSKQDLLTLLIFILAIISTYSTTGYVALLLILFFRFKRIKRLLSNVGAAINVMAVGILILGLTLFFTKGLSFDFFKGKIGREFGEQGEFVGRLGLDDLMLLFDDGTYWLGMSFEKYTALGHSSGNSIIHTLVTLGVPFVSTLLYMYCRMSSKFKTLLMFILFMMFFSAESLIWRPLFLTFAWYGTKNYSKIHFN